jgi:hypothetical protein
MSKRKIQDKSFVANNIDLVGQISETFGTVILIDNIGYGVVCQDGTDKKFFFTFDKIPGYRGESLKELPLQEGTHVSFIAHQQVITRLEPSTEANPQRLVANRV